MQSVIWTKFWDSLVFYRTVTISWQIGGAIDFPWLCGIVYHRWTSCACECLPIKTKGYIEDFQYPQNGKLYLGCCGVSSLKQCPKQSGVFVVRMTDGDEILLPQSFKRNFSWNRSWKTSYIEVGNLGFVCSVRVPYNGHLNHTFHTLLGSLDDEKKKYTKC